MVLGLVVGCYVGMNPEEGVESSGATLLRSYHKQRGKTGTILTRRPNLHVAVINTRRLQESKQQHGRRGRVRQRGGGGGGGREGREGERECVRVRNS